VEYDLIRLFEHPLRFRSCIPSAIVTLGGNLDAGRCEIAVEWRSSASARPESGTLTITWDVVTLQLYFAEIAEELKIIRTRDRDRARRIENAATVVAVAVMAHAEPATRFTERAEIGTNHDYYLNDSTDEMIEIAGRWEGGLPDLFAEKKRQSDGNNSLRKRWVSVTIFQKMARNRTAGVHP